jgi:hypothetical protein
MTESLTSVEAKALAIACAWLRSFVDDGIDEGGRSLMLNWIRGYAQTSRGRHHLVELAHCGLEEAHQVLMEMVNDFDERDERLPGSLLQYVIGVANRPFTTWPGKKKIDYLMRDLWVANLVGELALAFGIRPTRNRAIGRRESGCSLVAKAGNLTRLLPIKEGKVEKIFKQYWPAIAPTNPDYVPGRHFGTLLARYPPGPALLKSAAGSIPSKFG